MKLNRFQVRRLRFALDNRGKQIPLWRAFLEGWTFYLAFALVFGGGAAWLWSTGDTSTSAAFLGFLVALIWRDLTLALAASRFKAVADSVTDWNAVQGLLDDATET